MLEVHDHSQVLFYKLPNLRSAINVIFHFFKNGCLFSFMIVLTAKCQHATYKNMKQNKAAIIPFSKLSTFLRYSVFFGYQGQLNPVSEDNHYIYAIADHFSKHIVTVPTPFFDAYHAV